MTSHAPYTIHASKHFGHVVRDSHGFTVHRTASILDARAWVARHA